MATKRITTRALLIMAFFCGLAACSSGESQEEKLARATTLTEVVEAVSSETPAQAYAIEETKYLAVIFETTRVTRDSHLITAKRLMPVLLERYPEIDRFFIAWARDGLQFLKIQFERSEVQGVRWDTVMIKDGELEQLSSMYWSIPALR